DGFFGLESSGRAPVGPEAPSQPIWKAMKAMNFEFKVADFLPSALQKTRYVPEDHRPGLMREDLTPAIRGELIVQRGQGRTEARKFWAVKGDRGVVSVRAGDEDFQIGYNTKTRELPFSIKLLRAESKVDNGTQSPASYTSFVQLTDT